MRRLWIILVIALCGAVSGEDGLLARWDFADAKGADVPGSPGPAGEIVNLGSTARLVADSRGILLRCEGDYKDRNKAGGFAVSKLNLDPAKPFTVLCDFTMDDGHFKEFHELFGVFDGERGPGFRVCVFYGSIYIRSGDGKKVVQTGTNPATVQLPFGRRARLAAAYDGTRAELYLDGVKVASKEMKITPCKSRTFTCGSFQVGFAYPLNGGLGRLTVYQRALDFAEIVEDALESMQ